MRKATSFKTTFVALAVLLLPGLASANAISWTANLGAGQVQYHGFEVTSPGFFTSNVLSLFDNQHGIFGVSLARFSGTGYVTFTFGNLTAGNYLLGLVNRSDYTAGYIASVGSLRGQANAVPEPGILMLLGAGLLGLGLSRRRRHCV